MTSRLFDFAVTTIFAREVLEGAIIIGEYRTVILRGDSLANGIERKDALREVTLSAIMASILALLVIVAVAIPLAVLSNDFNPTTSKIIEGISKIVAAICLLQLSLKVPKWLGVYVSTKQKKDRTDALTIASIRFNVAWNIWREVAECGVFLLPFFLQGEGIISIPLSAVVGTFVGLVLGVGLYYANKSLEDKRGLAVFAVLLLVFLAAGLFTGGCNNFEKVWGYTPVVWELSGNFWSIDRLPMTVFKPFGYNNRRTLLQILCFWGYLSLAAILHYRKYRLSVSAEDQTQEDEEDAADEVEGGQKLSSVSSKPDHENESTGDVEVFLEA